MFSFILQKWVRKMYGKKFSYSLVFSRVNVRSAKSGSLVKFLGYWQCHGCLCLALLLFWQNCVGPLMNILKEHIVVMEKDHLISHQSELTAFFMTALDFRTEHAQVACLGQQTGASTSHANSISYFLGIKYSVLKLFKGVENIMVRYLAWNREN